METGSCRKTRENLVLAPTIPGLERSRKRVTFFKISKSILWHSCNLEPVEMKSPADSHEITILESKGILIHDQIFHAVLTDRRIILTRFFNNKLSIRSIYFTDIQEIEEDMNYSGDPVIILETSSAKGKIKKVVLHFSQKNFPDSIKERALWASEINKSLRSVSRVSHAPVLKKTPVTKAFCITCGTKFTDGSAFCAKCGTKIIYPEQPLPPQKTDISVIKRVKITEIPVVENDLPHRKRSISDTNDSSQEKKIPFTKPPQKDHTEHGKKKSF